MALNIYDSINTLSGGQLPSIPFRGNDNALNWGNIPNVPNIPTKLSDLPSGLASLQSTWSNLPSGFPNLPRGLPFFSGRLPEGLSGSYKFANRLLKGEVVGPGSFNPAKSVFRVTCVFSLDDHPLPNRLLSHAGNRITIAHVAGNARVGINYIDTIQEYNFMNRKLGS